MDYYIVVKDVSSPKVIVEKLKVVKDVGSIIEVRDNHLFQKRFFKKNINHFKVSFREYVLCTSVEEGIEVMKNRFLGSIRDSYRKIESLNKAIDNLNELKL
jgi:hypothetical protein